MGKINWARVLLGGLLAGTIINVFEFVTNGVFLAPEWKAMMEALGRTTPPSASGAVIFLIWGFLSGIGAIWLYAAARPRFGAGMKTAVLTGFAFWVLTTVLSTVDEAGVGLYPLRLLCILAIVCLVRLLRHRWPELGYTKSSRQLSSLLFDAGWPCHLVWIEHQAATARWLPTSDRTQTATAPGWSTIQNL